MTHHVTKKPRIAICKMCGGTGMMVDYTHDVSMTCPQCKGSGRVVVSCRMEVDVKPYQAGETV